MRTLLRLTSLAAFLAALALGMTACERRLTDANLSHIKPEMTTKEVEAILGSPMRVEATPEAAAALTPPPLDLEVERTEQAKQAAQQAQQAQHPGQQGKLPAQESGSPVKDSPSAAVVRYVYQQGERTVSLTFVGNRLAPGGISGSFE